MSSLSLTLLISLSVVSLLHHAHLPLSVTASSKCPPSPSPPLIVPKDQAQLKVLVPNITSGSLRQFVDCSDPSRVRGFCIAVFEIALSILIPANLSSSTIHYTCFNFSFIPPNFTDTLTYNDMIGAVANGSYDVVVGDVTITAKRALEVEFTHKYMESGVVIIAKVGIEHKSADWKLFGSPFTWPMWCTVLGCFVFTGTLLWIIEHKRHPEFTEGSFGKRVYKIFWFIVEALILLERDSIKSTTAQLVMVAWVFVVLLLGSSYTAGLSSILTASNLSPTVYDISMLKNSNTNISYRRGSILRDYLETRFHIPKTRLIATRATLDFVRNITNEKVIAIVDELAYANLLLDNLSSYSCNFGITGPQITSEGFGFGVRRGLQWVNPLSIALMNLTESGCLQELEHNYSISGTTNKCSSDSTSQKVSLNTSLSLFFPLISISYLCVITSHIIQLHRRRRRRRLSENQRSTIVTIDPSIVLAHHESTQRHRNHELELSIFPQT